MSYGGRDGNRDGGRDNSKRKNQWPQDNGAKRAHVSSHGPREEFYRSSRWDRGGKPHEQAFPRSNWNSWVNRERSSRGRFPNPPSNRNHYNHVFDYKLPSVSSGPQRESEELIGPGSDLERMEKVLATKKRIEEALASNSPSSNNREINFQNSSRCEDKSRDKESHGPNLDLSLTNSDFKEIGSVGSAIPTEGDSEPADLIINTSSISSRTSQQRSFNNTTSNSPVNVQVSQPKSQKIGGWSMSSVNNIVAQPNQSGSSSINNIGAQSNQSSSSSVNNIVAQPNQSSSPRPRSDMYLQEQREEILGDVSSAIHENDTVESAPSTQPNDNQNYDDEFSRVGRLYQSFLKSRLFGYTLRVRNNSQKQTGPNPLLDKSVLENSRTGNLVSEDQVIELQMPQPMRVKMENNIEQNTESTPEYIAAEEANEFCKEFSFLLKDPNFLIPPGDLEKLGLSHLTEMNKLINDKRSGITQQSSENEDGTHIRNSGTLESVGRSDMGITINRNSPPFSTSQSFGQRQNSESYNDKNTSSRNDPTHPDPRNGNISFPQNLEVPAFQNVSVEAVLEKVVKTILQPSHISSVLNLNLPSTPEGHPSNRANESHSSIEPGTSFSDTTKRALSNQLQDVSSKILRLFLIDKQIEELMNEKMKIYSELLSSQGVSQTLFHSWAQDQIQQGNVMNVISNTSNVMPELNRVLNHSQEINPNLSHSSGFPLSINPNNTVGEAITELQELYQSLKKENVNPDFHVPQTEVSNTLTGQVQESDSLEPSVLPSDSCFLPPKDVVVEENRPKLSVRKDLIDPDRSNISLLNPPLRIPTSTEDQSDQMNPSDVDRTTMKREKKKKKGKKKDSVEVINLIEDTDDEISNSTGRESVATDDLSSRGLNSEDEVEKEDSSVGSLKISYDLDSKIATCIEIMSLKKSPTKVLVVGCKDGFVMGYALGNPTISFSKQIHKDTITSVFYNHKYLITGSADSTVCLFSLKEQVATQTLSVQGAVQSMDMNFKQLIVGTKTGSINIFMIKIDVDKKKVFVSLHPKKKNLIVTNSSILAVKLAKEGAREVLIVASRGEQITVRDAASGLLLRSFDWCDTVYCLHLYEETHLVYCGTNTKSVKVVNYTDGENAGDCMVGRSITQITFLQSVMFAASYDGNIYVYDVEKKRLIATLVTSKGIIQGLAIDGKCNVIIVCSSRGDLHQIPFPHSVTKHLKKLRSVKKKNQQTNIMQATNEMVN